MAFVRTDYPVSAKYPVSNWWLRSNSDAGKGRRWTVDVETYRNGAEVQAARSIPYLPPPCNPGKTWTEARKCRPKKKWDVFTEEAEEPKIVTPSHKLPSNSGPEAEEPKIVTPSHKRPNNSGSTGGMIKTLKWSDMSYEGPSSPGSTGGIIKILEWSDMSYEGRCFPGPKAEEPKIVTSSHKRPSNSVNTGGKVKRLKVSDID